MFSVWNLAVHIDEGTRVTSRRIHSKSPIAVHEWIVPIVVVVIAKWDYRLSHSFTLRLSQDWRRPA